MVTTAFCVCGNWLTGRPNSERRPSTRISRLITAASTGRRMKRSVNFMAWDSLFLRRRVRVACRLHAVVDDDLGAILQLELAAGHDLLAPGNAAKHGHLVAARRAGGDEDLLDLRRLAGRDDEHGGAVGVVGDGALRQREVTLL